MNVMTTLLTIWRLSTSTEISVNTVAQVKMRILKQIDITCEDKPEETFQNEQNVADNIYDTEYEYLRHNLIDFHNYSFK